jgi:hypothetical protein
MKRSVPTAAEPLRRATGETDLRRSLEYHVISPSHARLAARTSPLLLGALVACGGSTADPTATSRASVVLATEAPTATDVPSASPSLEPTAEASPSPDPAAEREHEIGWAIPFSITTPGTWRPDPMLPSTPRTLAFAAGVDRWLVFHRPDADTVDAALDVLRSRSTLSLTDPAPVDIGGAQGVVFDLSLADDAAPDEVTLFEDPSLGAWSIERGRPNRIWLVDVDGTILMIVTDAPAGAFDTFVATADAALATLEWSR